MTTPTTVAATTAVLPAPVSTPGCRDRADRPTERIASYSAGDPRALREADRTAEANAPRAHVRYSVRGARFVVVQPYGEAR
ncbi:hypothetical protein AB0B12_37970 [Streptomyces sp. NPDC044780]|uniref:hypothetical protein n=1 Tax=unclassified Streptomyces TaxID=2593676 RepID=UPI0033F44687